MEEEIIDDKILTKIVNLNVSEQATGEILASAGVGTDGTTVGFGIKETF